MWKVRGMKNTKGGSVFQVGKSYYTRAGRVVEVVKVDSTAVHGYVKYATKKVFKIWSADGRSTAKNRSPADLTEAQVSTLAAPAPIAEVQFGSAQKLSDNAFPPIPGSPVYDNNADEDLVPKRQVRFEQPLTTKLPYRVKYVAELKSAYEDREFFSPLFDSETYTRRWAATRNYTVLSVRRAEVY